MNIDLIIASAIFFGVALAAKKIGAWFSQIGLPYITGYLLAGMAAGPFILNVMPEDSTTTLRYVDEISLGVIAFVAGSELYIKEIRSRIKSISWVTTSVVLAAIPLGGVALFVLTEFIPFTQGMPLMDRLAVAILGSTILLALSPASTIAVIKEVRAQGTFTRTVLGITVTMDVVIIVLFAVAAAIAAALLTGTGFNASFALLLIADLALAAGVGYGAGKLLNLLLGLGIDKRVKIGLILAIGYAIFVAGFWLVEFTKSSLPFELHIEPLLVAMIAGFFVTNFTSHREQFAELLHDIGPAVYVAFFTLTGVGIKLDILSQTWTIALALFAVRVISIAIGSFVGSKLAGESNEFQKYAWMGLITQAGIALGLAREVAVEFPQLGDAFATMVISVVVLNEIFGPMFLKSALSRAGETNLPEKAESNSVRDVVIFGIEEQSLALARQLQTENWRVVMADNDRTHVERLKAEDVVEYFLPSIDAETINGLLTGQTDAAVMMLSSDDANLRAAELAYKAGVRRLVVRPNDVSRSPEFTELGALIIDPASAMVNLLDQTVRSPQTAAVMLHQDSGRQLVQITINNPDVHGMLVRDLVLPSDVLFVDVTRNGSAIVPNGYTKLALNDEITLIGNLASLEEATVKLGY